MQKAKTLAQIFQHEPSSWGLRGDPYLWGEMKTALGERAFPRCEADLAVLLEQTYQQLTGASIRETQPVFVERYSRGGMSSGQVSPQFWLETALPLLCERYRETK